MVNNRMKEIKDQINHFRGLVFENNSVDKIGKKSVYQSCLIMCLEKYIDSLEKELEYYKSTRWL